MAVDKRTKVKGTDEIRWLCHMNLLPTLNRVFM